MTCASWRSAGLVACLALLWGSNFLWIKVAVDDLSPAHVTFLRLATGALVLWPIIRAQHERLPLDRGFLGHLFVAALFGNALPYLLFAIGEQSVDSALAGVLTATTPLWTMLVAFAAGSERTLTLSKLAGLLMGFAGVLLIFNPWQGVSGSAGGQLACLAAAASYGVSYVYMARFLAPREPSPFVLAFGQLTTAAVLLVPPTLLVGSPSTVPVSTVWALLALGPIGTGLAYVINYAIIARDGATVASTVTYLLPVVSVILGAAILDESITASVTVGAAVVLLAVALSRHGTASVAESAS